MEHEVWVDHDYPARPRRHEDCKKCGRPLVLRHHCERQVSLAAYVGMLTATNIGWIIGTVLYHHFN